MINPCPPKKDFQRIVSFEGVALRYEVKLLDCHPTDEKRRYVMNVYPSDDTFSMYEYEDRFIFYIIIFFFFLFYIF
jgi:hypothetical protein